MMADTPRSIRTPRILLLTWWPPDTRYKVMQRNAGRMPAGSVCWASLRAANPGVRFPWPHESAVPRPLHYRLDRTALGQWFAHEAQGAQLARRLADWARAFEPEVVWVLPELGAANVGLRLARRLDVPIHATVHDAHETARFIVPPLYYPLYARSVRRILGAANSADAICGPMREYLSRRHANLTSENCIVFPPSVLPGDMQLAPEPPTDGRIRRIGFCGSMRVSARQWSAFLQLLARLPFEFELILFAYEDLFHDVPLPANVRVALQPFAEEESGIIDTFHRCGVHACYLGLWKEPERLLFGRTSLSAKLTTYAAAGLPVIVDGGADSSAWDLVSRYGAGVLCGDDEASARAELDRLMSDASLRRSMGAGAARMCRVEFDLDANAARLAARLARTAAGGARG